MTFLSAWYSTPAFAPHSLAGMALQTFAHGILSGVGHPVPGFDHLFFVMNRPQNTNAFPYKCHCPNLCAFPLRVKDAGYWRSGWDDKWEPPTGAR